MFPRPSRGRRPLRAASSGTPARPRRRNFASLGPGPATLLTADFRAVPAQRARPLSETAAPCPPTGCPRAARGSPKARAAPPRGTKAAPYRLAVIVVHEGAAAHARHGVGAVHGEAPGCSPTAPPPAATSARRAARARLRAAARPAPLRGRYAKRGGTIAGRGRPARGSAGRPEGRRPGGGGEWGGGGLGAWRARGARPRQPRARSGTDARTRPGRARVPLSAPKEAARLRRRPQVASKFGTRRRAPAAWNKGPSTKGSTRSGPAGCSRVCFARSSALYLTQRDGGLKTWPRALFTLRNTFLYGKIKFACPRKKEKGKKKIQQKTLARVTELWVTQCFRRAAASSPRVPQYSHRIRASSLWFCFLHSAAALINRLGPGRSGRRHSIASSPPDKSRKTLRDRGNGRAQHSTAGGTEAAQPASVSPAPCACHSSELRRSAWGPTDCRGILW